MLMKPKLGFCLVYHPFEENSANIDSIFNASKDLLNGMTDLEVFSVDQHVMDVESAISAARQFKDADVDVICIKLATWSSDNAILDISSIHDVPFIFWTYPHVHAGSFCGGHQFNMVFKELGKECIIAHKDDKPALEKIRRFTKIMALRNQLKQARFGRIGNRTQGMAEVICDEFSVKEVLGPRMLSIGLDAFKALVREQDDALAQEEWNKLQGTISEISVTQQDGINAVKNYMALKQWIRENKLNGVTIECYQDYMGKTCLGFSLLADEGFPGACEGDINSLVLMHVLMELSDGPVHDIDPLHVYEEDASLLGSHCGCGSFSLAADLNNIKIANARLANSGVCVLFPSKPGIVTMANLVGRKGTYRMCALEAEAIPTEMDFPGNPIRIRLPCSQELFLNTIEDRGIGHHWIVAYGNYKESLRIFSNSLGIDFIEI